MRSRAQPALTSQRQRVVAGRGAPGRLETRPVWGWGGTAHPRAVRKTRGRRRHHWAGCSLA